MQIFEFVFFKKAIKQICLNEIFSNFQWQKCDDKILRLRRLLNTLSQNLKSNQRFFFVCYTIIR